ncbi:MAG: hypothetical protein ACQERD_04510 [Campylobacterota bacterium]
MNFSYFKYTNDFVGFDNNREFLPKDFDKFNSKYRLRQLFLSLSNNVLKEFCHFSKKEQRRLSFYPLKIAFEYKIETLLPNSMLRKPKINSSFNFCLKSTIIINNYLYGKKTDNSLFVRSKNLLAAAKLISHCFINNNMQLLIDKHLLFHEFVLNKVSRLHKDKEVTDLGDSISIKSNGVCNVKIYTSWKDIEVKNPNIKDELENAIKSIKKGESNQVYLAYPKDDKFKRQIPIFVNELKSKEYQIKVIPYSLRSIMR